MPAFITSIKKKYNELLDGPDFDEVEVEHLSKAMFNKWFGACKEAFKWATSRNDAVFAHLPRAERVFKKAQTAVKKEYSALLRAITARERELCAAIRTSGAKRKAEELSPSLTVHPNGKILSPGEVEIHRELDKKLKYVPALEDAPKCDLCCEEYKDFQPRCGHSTCVQCAYRWISDNHTRTLALCGFCRQPFTVADLEKLGYDREDIEVILQRRRDAAARQAGAGGAAAHAAAGGAEVIVIDP